MVWLDWNPCKLKSESEMVSGFWYMLVKSYQDQINKINYKADIFHTTDWSRTCDEGIESYDNRAWKDNIDYHIDIILWYLGGHDTLLEATYDLQLWKGWLSQWLTRSTSGSDKFMIFANMSGGPMVHMCYEVFGWIKMVN